MKYHQGLNSHMDSTEVIERTRRWIDRVVIGLNLCPFARRAFEAGLIRYSVTGARDADELLVILDKEMHRLAAEPRAAVETTLLIHPGALKDFLAFNDFLADADRLIDSRRLRGVIQIASFHPRYQFEGAAPDDVENGTNRSPFPMLHLLREESITEVASDPQVLLGIPQRNIELLRRLGREKLHSIIRGENQPPGV
jgi:uncharacterized protein